MYQKLPYYMAYPIQTEYDEKAERTDLEYMKSLYPDLPKRILPYVEEECDRMEYTGSVMFDVYPDKLQLRIMCNRICENVKKQEKMFAGEERMLRNLAEVLLYQEIYRRREFLHRRCSLSAIFSPFGRASRSSRRTAPSATASTP